METTDDEESPERSASNSLMEEGKIILERGSLDRSGDLFQEAVSVDPTNGVAYYYLALVKFKGGEYGGVWRFLEKAESLLSKKPEWMAKLKELQAELERQKPD
jgi:cytochrome c-type biogenesis protein CcmH/NrfG